MRLDEKDLKKFLEDHQLFIQFIDRVILGESERMSCTEREAGNLLNFLISFVCDVNVRYKHISSNSIERYGKQYVRNR